MEAVVRLPDDLVTVGWLEEHLGDPAIRVVDIRGYVRSEAERERALQLARETDGVIRVVDGLRVR